MAQEQTAVERRRARDSTTVHFRVARKLNRLIRDRARQEGQSVSAWLKFAAVRELRRKRAPL